VKDEVQRRKMQCLFHEKSDDELKFLRPVGHEQFHTFLVAARLITPCSIEEHQWNSPSSTMEMEQTAVPHYTKQPKLLANPMYEEPIQRVE
jgi:1D-myo-inositol 3-kinase